MKCFLLSVSLCLSLSAWGKDIKKFNQVLLENLEKDVKSENDLDLKSPGPIHRAPASVEADDVAPKQIKEENKIEKNFQQIGGKNW